MSAPETVGRLLLTLGAIFLTLGLILVALARFPFLGRLPGDIHVRSGNVSRYLPLMTGIALSIVATVVLKLILWLLRK